MGPGGVGIVGVVGEWRGTVGWGAVGVAGDVDSASSAAAMAASSTTCRIKATRTMYRPTPQITAQAKSPPRRIPTNESSPRDCLSKAGAGIGRGMVIRQELLIVIRGVVDL